MRKSEPFHPSPFLLQEGRGAGGEGRLCHAPRRRKKGLTRSREDREEEKIKRAFSAQQLLFIVSSFHRVRSFFFAIFAASRETIFVNAAPSRPAFPHPRPLSLPIPEGRGVQLVAFALLLSMLAAPAHAHTRSQSFSTWTVGVDSIDGIFQVDAYRATQLSETPQDLPTLVANHLASTVKLTQDGAACTATAPRAVPAPRGDIRVALRFACPKPFAQAPATLTVGAFFEVSISHVHYVRLAGTTGQREAILTEGRTAIDIGAAAPEQASTFTSFLLLGYEHVLSGVDHIAFLIALAMLAGGIWRILIAVTGFTLGHSLTLALVALGILKPETAAIEALIGFTVAWAAGDALARARGIPQSYALIGAVGILLLPPLAHLLGLPVLPWLVIGGVALFAVAMSFARGIDAPYVAPVIATVFGLAHGAGFAGPLLELHIPPGSLIWTLLAFNIGVELGQLTALAILAAALWALRRTFKVVPPLAFDATAALLFALGTFWFVSRALA